MRVGYEQAGPSALAELEHLHVELNSECSRKSQLHFLKLTLLPQCILALSHAAK